MSPRWVSHLSAGHLVEGQLPLEGARLFATAHRRPGPFLLDVAPWPALFSPGAGTQTSRRGVLRRPVPVPGVTAPRTAPACPWESQ